VISRPSWPIWRRRSWQSPAKLGLNVAESRHDEALATIHEEIVRIKSMGADVEAESGNKFLSAGKFPGPSDRPWTHAQAADLRDGATQARTIVARLAAVMQNRQVGQGRYRAPGAGPAVGGAGSMN